MDNVVVVVQQSPVVHLEEQVDQIYVDDHMDEQKLYSLHRHTS